MILPGDILLKDQTVTKFCALEKKEKILILKERKYKIDTT